MIPLPYKLLKGSDIKIQLWKVLNRKMNHNGFQYQIGQNTLEEKFRPEGDCLNGGLYVTWRPELFLEYGEQIARVTLPPDAQVWTMDNKLKTDRLILESPVPSGEAKLDWLSIVKQNCYYLEYITAQTPEICIAAVRQYGLMLQHVKKQTTEICLAAVQNYGLALRFVKKQTTKICIAAVRQSGMALRYVKDQTYKICLAAVRQDANALQHAEYQTVDICLIALKQNIDTACFIRQPSPGLVRAIKEVIG